MAVQRIWAAAQYSKLHLMVARRSFMHFLGGAIAGPYGGLLAAKDDYLYGTTAGGGGSGTGCYGYGCGTVYKVKR